MSSGAERLDDTQRRFLDKRLGSWSVVADLSWGLVDTVVLEAETDEGHVVVKAAGPANGHIAREIRGHREWTAPWLATGHVGRLLAADEAARVLVLTYLPGRLVEGTPAQDEPDIYRQAGRLIAALHAQYSEHDPTWNDRLRGRVERFLAMPHHIDPEAVARVRSEIDAWPGGGVTVVPTHGDWQPRNWLDDDGELRVIDLGRADLRPPEEDFVRLARQDFARNPVLEAAFIDGYGHDPRDPSMWRRTNVAEAVGTAAWALAVGDKPFEALGHAHLARLYPA